MENHPEVLREIQALRPLICGSADSISRARSSDLLESACRAVGGQTLLMQPRLPTDTPAHVLFDQSDQWVMKPSKSSAGHGMIRFSSSSAIPTPRPGHDAYFQPWFTSTRPTLDISVAFHAFSHDVTLLGATRQLIGDSAFGARHSTQYVGNICPGPPHLLLTTDQLTDVLKLGQEIAHLSGLQGPFGIDMIGSASSDDTYVDRLHVLEINPRYTSGMEVIELATGVLVFSNPSVTRRIPIKPISSSSPQSHGKAIVYARADCTVPDLWEHLRESQVADVPEPGEQVPAGRPICTVLAQGNSISDCHANLASFAQTVYTLCKP